MVVLKGSHEVDKRLEGTYSVGFVAVSSRLAAKRRCAATNCAWISGGGSAVAGGGGGGGVVPWPMMCKEEKFY